MFGSRGIYIGLSRAKVKAISALERCEKFMEHSWYLLCKTLNKLEGKVKITCIWLTNYVKLPHLNNYSFLKAFHAQRLTFYFQGKYMYPLSLRPSVFSFLPEAPKIGISDTQGTSRFM